MEKLLKNVGFVVLAFLLISTVMILYSGPKQKPKDVSLSEIVNQINNGQIKTITIDANNLAIELNDGTKEKSVKEPQSSLTESLSNYGVDKDKRAIYFQQAQNGLYVRMALLQMILKGY